MISEHDQIMAKKEEELLLELASYVPRGVFWRKKQEKAAATIFSRMILYRSTFVVYSYVDVIIGLEMETTPLTCLAPKQ